MHAIEAVITAAGDDPADRAETVGKILLQIVSVLAGIAFLALFFSVLPYILFVLVYIVGPAALVIGTIGWIFDAWWGLGTAVAGGVLIVIMLALRAADS